MSSRTLVAETRALHALACALGELVASSPQGITLRCGRFKLTNVTAVEKAPPQAKADFVIRSDSQPPLFISHKDKGFCWNGYGSGGTKAFPHRSRYRDPSIWRFASWAAAHCASTQPVRHVAPGYFEWVGSTRGLWAIPPHCVQNLIVYGAEFGGDFSLHNCHIAGVGTPRIVRDVNEFVLSFEDGTTSNGDVPTGSDLPIIVIGGCVGSERKTYSVNEHSGFRGWLGFFPVRLIEKSQQRGAPVGKPGKGDGLVQVSWPHEI